MTSFKKRSIYRWEKKASRWIQGHLALTVILLILGVLMLKGVVGAMQKGQPFSITQIVTHAISDGVNVDRHGNTNILLLGIGGENHDGGTLTDTMIVASIDHRSKHVSMLSIPRDIYVENEAVGWGTRLNSVYEYAADHLGSHEKGIQTLEEQIGEILGVEIHYYAMVDFTGFKDIVDAVGGVDINLGSNFYDPFYPAEFPTDEFPHDPFFLEAGIQNIDGETALKYVRSRQTSSDFDRSKRQQDVISAIKDKALSAGFLLNPNKIKNTFAALSNNISTDLSVSDIISLAKLSEDINSEDILSQVITDGANLPGGFLYTPEREFFEGAFVLVPFAGNWSEIQTFAHLLFYEHELYTDDVSVQVLNGTKEEGLAGLTKMYLVRYGFNVSAFGNAASKEVPNSSVFLYDSLSSTSEAARNTVTLMLPLLGNVQYTQAPPTDYADGEWPKRAEIIFEIGDDFIEFYKDNEEKFYLGFY